MVLATQYYRYSTVDRLALGTTVIWLICWWRHINLDWFYACHRCEWLNLQREIFSRNWTGFTTIKVLPNRKRLFLIENWIIVEIGSYQIGPHKTLKYWTSAFLNENKTGQFQLRFKTESELISKIFEPGFTQSSTAAIFLRLSNDAVSTSLEFWNENFEWKSM